MKYFSCCTQFLTKQKKKFQCCIDSVPSVDETQKKSHLKILTVRKNPKFKKMPGFKKC